MYKIPQWVFSHHRIFPTHGWISKQNRFRILIPCVFPWKNLIPITLLYYRHHHSSTCLYIIFYFFFETPFNAYNNISNITRVFRRQSALVSKLQGPTKIQYCLGCFVYNFFHILYLFFLYGKKDRRFSFQISRIFISGHSNLTPATCTFIRLKLNKVLFFKVGKGMWKGGT